MGDTSVCLLKQPYLSLEIEGRAGPPGPHERRRRRRRQRVTRPRVVPGQELQRPVINGPVFKQVGGDLDHVLGAPGR